MRHTVLLLFTLALVAWLPRSATAQDTAHDVTGQVISADDSAPLPGVNVQVQGTTVGASTDVEGRYQLTAPSPQDTLIFSFVGFERQTVPIDGRTTVDVTMTSSSVDIEGVVVTGYRELRREQVTGSVTVIDTDDIERSSSANVVSDLQGRIPGLSINQTGSPFGDAEALIRGEGTLGNNAPLFVIDGIPSKAGAVRQLNPKDIESMQVLRDAATASLYGSRASNGVVVITTRQGKEGQFQVNYSADITASQMANRHDVLNTEQRGRVVWQAAVNDGRDPDNLPIYNYDWSENDGTPVLNEVIVPEYLGDPDDGIRAADTDWYDEISRMGLVQQHNLSVTAGNERGSSYLSLRYHENDAIVKNQNFRRIGARINTDYTFFDGRLTLGENLAVSHEQGTPLPEGLGGTPLNLSLLVQPIIPVRTEDGGWGGPVGAGFDDRDNPVRLLSQNRWDQQSAVHGFGNAFARLDVTDDLQWNARFGVDWRRELNRDIQRTYQSGFLSRDLNSLTRINSDNLELTLSTTLEYDVGLSDHELTLLGGFEASQSEFQSNSTFQEDFAVESLEFFVEGAGSGRQIVDGGQTGFSLLSYFGQANWAYENRYQASLTARVDGSSRFGAENRYGFFPALSAGWRLSDEPFLNDVDALSNLMLRGSLGIVGNQEIGNEAQFTLFESLLGTDISFAPDNGTAYDIGGQGSGNIPAGFRRVQTGNPALSWEETTEANLGIDWAVLDRRLRGSVDTYWRETTDILIQPPFLAAEGEGGNRWFNAAAKTVRGFDARVRYQDDVRGVEYDLTGTFGLYRDEITELPEDVIDAFPGNVEQDILGRSSGSLFGYVVDGIFQNEDEVSAHAEQPGKDVGRLRFADLDGDGRITPLDQDWIGNTTPDFVYGLNANAAYGNFSVRLFLQGEHGRDVVNQEQKLYTDFSGIWNGANYGTRTLDAWTPENRDTDIPALSLSDDNNEQRFSTYFVENGSYLKLREVQVRYTVPERLTTRVQAQNVDLYVRGQNLFTLDAPSFTGVDPEVPGQLFPLARSFTVGIDLTF